MDGTSAPIGAYVLSQPREFTFTLHMTGGAAKLLLVAGLLYFSVGVMNEITTLTRAFRGSDETKKE